MPSSTDKIPDWAPTNACILPWMHLATLTDGSIPLCCIAKPFDGLNVNEQTISEIWNSDQYKTARKEMLANKKLPQCNHCWKEEASGIISHRQNENNLWFRKLGAEKVKDLVLSTNPDGSITNPPLTFDLRLGNTCNLQCVMCRPYDSSKWLSDAKKLAQALQTDAKYDWEYKSKIDTTRFEWYKRDKIWQDLEPMLKEVRHMIFAGGEPLLIKEHKKLLQKLVEYGHSKNIELRYHNNATVLDDDVLELWTNFKDVELMLSIDAWGDKNYYVRYPALWPVVEANLERLDQTPDNIEIKILASVHAMNIYDLPDFAVNLLEKNFKKVGQKAHSRLFHAGTVHWPPYLCTQVLPSNVKDKITEKFDSYDHHFTGNKDWPKIKAQIKFMNDVDSSNLFPQFREYTQQIDKLRNLSFSNTFPEYAKLLEL